MNESSSESRSSLRWSLAAACLAGLAGVIAVGLVVDRPETQPSPAMTRKAAPVAPAAPEKPPRPETPASISTLDSETLDRRIDLAVDYLVRSCGSDGRFVYWVHLDPQVTLPPSYNVLRHAGAMYALGMYHDAHPDARVRDALVRAGDFLRRECVEPLPGRDDLLGVWSPPELVLRGEPPQAKLGGAGLGLVGLLAAERASPGMIPLDELRKLGQFLLYLQKEDGSFYTKFIPIDGGRWDEWLSLYYPGEAALGLVMLYEHDPRPEWLAAAAGAIQYLAAIREGDDDVPADHWALIATARLLRLADQSPLPIDRAALVAHAAQICERMLRNQSSQQPGSPLRGSFTRDGRTTPAATQLEGLLAALEFLPAEDPALAAQVDEAVERGIAFLLRAQVVTGPHTGGVPRAIQPLPGDDPSDDLEAFNRRVGEIRIDYVQHAASAMMQYRRLHHGR